MKQLGPLSSFLQTPKYLKEAECHLSFKGGKKKPSIKSEILIKKKIDNVKQEAAVWGKICVHF